MHAMRGYQPGEFQDHQAVLVASLSQIAQKVRLRRVQPNALLTRILRGLLAETSRLLGALGAAQTDVTSYDCLADATIDGQPVVVAFVGTVQSMVIAGGWTGNSVDLRVTLRGWCAAPADFVNDTPVLERIFSSMQLSAAFLERITQGNAQAAGKIRETYAYMNEVDQQIRDKHWDTMDAIAEMSYDTLRDTGGYVNEKTGRIEQIPADKVLKNSSGEYVSREEFERGVPLDQCTVLRGAYSDDYMKGTYGRVVFTPW
jgi:hypothetical protein